MTSFAPQPQNDRVVADPAAVRRSGVRGRADVTAANSQDVLHLQRTIGNSAVTRLLKEQSERVQRIIVVNPATVETRPLNPAQQFAAGEGLAQLELGFTKIKVNDGDHRLYSFKAPKPEVSDLKADYVPRHPPVEVSSDPLFGSEYEPDERDAQAQKEHDSDRYASWVTAVPTNTFDWVVTNTPAEPWAVDEPVPAGTLSKLVGEIKAAGGTGDDPGAVTKPGPLRVFSPAGNIVAHTEVHERQHIEDHIDVIEAQVRPWDRRMTAHRSRETAIKAPSLGEASSLMKPPLLFAHHIEQSGTNFHKEEDGQLPALHVTVDGETGGVAVRATPVKVMTATRPGHYIERPL